MAAKPGWIQLGSEWLPEDTRLINGQAFVERNGVWKPFKPSRSSTPPPKGPQLQEVMPKLQLAQMGGPPPKAADMQALVPLPVGAEAKPRAKGKAASKNNSRKVSFTSGVISFLLFLEETAERQWHLPGIAFGGYLVVWAGRPSHAVDDDAALCSGSD